MRKVIYWLVVVGCIFFTTSQPQAATTLNYEYDANGSMTSGDGKYFEYNDANQLVRVRHGDASGPVIAEYVYDFNGQRIKKVENGVKTYYVGKHFEQEVAGEEQTTTSYYFANGERVAKKESGVLEYYHSDHLGGTNAVTDVSAHLVEQMNYFPFGEMREGGSEKYLYTGKEKDTQSDLYYYEARFYNPQIKHFTQADTISPDVYDPQDLNRYSYVRNNPVKYIDPTGHTWWNPSTWVNKNSNQNNTVKKNNYLSNKKDIKPEKIKSNISKGFNIAAKAVEIFMSESSKILEVGKISIAIDQAGDTTSASIKNGKTDPKFASERLAVESLINVGSIVTTSGKMGVENNNGVQKGLDSIFSLENRYKKMEEESGVKLEKFYKE